ncbi:ATP-binding protein [Sphingomonas psychrotolerans]|uniref:histidine kinase n=1 Tax=Sphingomonas psychrotolerans TaxID=1327635 RepID=A0ABU3N5J1_9SPHN|nr:ATP-binding protein [Sphingomonas psychrotolerans]MDT8759757.1 ATP-binding protein [Sphingomonas psychrotolerans]
MSSAHSERALILAPQGRDAAVAQAMLAEAGIDGVIVPSPDALAELLPEGAGFALVTEEALASADLNALSRWINDQPEWSDFPFVLLTQRGGGLERNPAASRYLQLLGNVTFLERPFHPTTLVSFAHAAIRARCRQYEARARLEELHELATSLEQRVEERTAEHKAAVAQLHEAQKLETLGQLTGGVAHDFNNLLTPIMGALDMLQRKYGESDARSARLIDNALLSAERAKTLVQRLLGFARRQTLETKAVDLGELIDGMRDLIASSIGPEIDLRIRHEAGLPPAMADPNQLELAILNLCVNARDAMERGGTLTIVVDQQAFGPGSQPRLTPGLYVRLSVIDTGCGMDAETLARAVEPFYSTKETGRGTGLGLSMVHGLAAQLGGGFALSSEPGQGTRADLYLRAAEPDVARTPTERRRAPLLAKGRGLSVLLVDDEDLVRMGTAEMIRDLGHEVTHASGGAEALARLESGLRPDVVITDYKMPRMDGAEFAGRVRDVLPAMPILLITGYTGTTVSTHDLPRLSKPFGQAEIAAALAALVEPDDKVVRLPTGRRS